MVSEIQEEKQGEGLRLQEQYHYNDYLHLRASAYSLFILAIRSPQTKQKYLQRFGYFLDFAQVATEKGILIEERCNKLAELANNDYKWFLNCIFSYLQSLRSRVESKQIKPSTLRNNIKPIKLFCEQMDIDIPWKKLIRGMPKERKYANDRAPKLEEIIRISVHGSFLAIGAFAGGQIGARFSHRIEERMLQKLLSIILIGSAIKLLFDFINKK